VFPESVTRESDQLTVRFPGDAYVVFSVRHERGMLLFELKDANVPETTKRFVAFSLSAPYDAEIMGTLNAASAGSYVAAVMAAEPNVQAFSSAVKQSDGDRAGCTHEVTPSIKRRKASQRRNSRPPRTHSPADGVCVEPVSGAHMT